MTATLTPDSGADGIDGVDGTAGGVGVATDEPSGADPDVRPWSWHLSRASAVALVALLPLHLWSFHLDPNARPLTVQAFTDRWGTPWRLLDWATIVLALIHGAIALQPAEAPADGSADGPSPSTVARLAGTSALVAAAVVIGVLTYAVAAHPLP